MNQNSETQSDPFSLMHRHPEEERGGLGEASPPTANCAKPSECSGASLCASHSRRPWPRRSCKPGCRQQTFQIQPPKLAPTNKHVWFLVPEHSRACRQSATTTTTLVGCAFPNPGTAPGASQWPHCALRTEGMQFVWAGGNSYLQKRCWSNTINWPG